MTVTTQYDEQFKDAGAKWLPEWDWLYFRAQGYAESLLQPDAVSSEGAKGLMQFEDPTWEDVKFRLRFPFSASPFDPQYAIPAGVYFDALMRNGWAAPRSEDDRRALSFASYNAGFGNILKAQKEAKDAADWQSISRQLWRITGADNAKQTIDYVNRIEQYYQQFKGEENATGQ
ncbi:MAG: transglycosylase SLT domain-containing protein [Gammaproteobacteria bacterium]